MAAQRDVVNHVLFEVATEVANRGQSSPPLELCDHVDELYTNHFSQLVVSTRSSSRKRK